MAIALELSSISPELKAEITKTCIVKPFASQYNDDPQPVMCFATNAKENSIYVPMGAWRHFLDEFPNYVYPRTTVMCKKKLYTIYTDPKGIRDQDIVAAEALEKLEKDHTVFIAAQPGYGKCLDPDTEVLMVDGTKKLAKNIKPLDLLMGDDSTPRTVLSTCSGIDEMYEIVPNKGESFVVNSPHVLTLYVSSHFTIRWDKSRNTYVVTYFDGCGMKTKHFKSEDGAEKFIVENKETYPQIIDIDLQKYLGLPDRTKHYLKAVYTGVDYCQQNTPIDPYMFGLWLGDGHSSGSLITNTDKEIIDYCLGWASLNELEFVQTTNPIVYRFRGKIYRKNKFQQFLHQYHLMNNKHIPLIYKANDRFSRLQLLAGLIDSDGYYREGCYEIIQKNKKLAQDILDLCRSLGFGSFMVEVQKTCTNSINGRITGAYQRITFSGVGLEHIPVLLSRKKSAPRKQIKNPLVTAFKVNHLGKGKYCGFELDGNGRFLLGTYMITHNTTLGNYFTAHFKLKTAVICHIDKVNDQWVEEFEVYSTAKVQRVKGTSALDPTADVYVFGVQKAASMPREALVDIGLVIFDEAHIATVTAFTKSLLKFQPKYVVGLSATPKRPDGMHKMLTMYFGPKKGFIVREEVKDFTVYKVETPFKPTIRYNMFQGQTTLDWTTLINSIAYNEERQTYIVSLVTKHPDHRIMVLSDRQQECDAVYQKLLDLGEKSVLKLTGAVDKIKKICAHEGCSTKPSFNFVGEDSGKFCAKHRTKEMINVSKQKKKVNTMSYRIIVAGMKKAGVGFNDPTLNMLILAADRREVEQLEGRIRTTNNIIYDLVDDYKTLETHWNKREAWYAKRGANVEVISLREIPQGKTRIPQRRMLGPMK